NFGVVDVSVVIDEFIERVMNWAVMHHYQVFARHMLKFVLNFLPAKTLDHLFVPCELIKFVKPNAQWGGSGPDRQAENANNRDGSCQEPSRRAPFAQLPHCQENQSQN